METAKRKALVETLKSVGRGLWFGLLGLIVVALTAIATSGNITDMGVSVGGFTLNYSVIILAVVSYAIKLLDTYIHNNQNTASQGLAPAFLQGPSTPVVAPVVVQPAQPLEPTVPAQPSQPAPQTPAPAADDGQGILQS